MTSKEHPIKILEQALEYEEKRLAECRENIKSLKNRVTKDEGLSLEIISNIAGVKDAILKLKGIANLEEKNKI